MQKPVFNKIKPTPPIEPLKFVQKEELIPELTSFSDLKEFVSKLEKEYPNVEKLYIGCGCSDEYGEYCYSSNTYLCFSIKNENFEEQNEKYLKDLKAYKADIKDYNKSLKEFKLEKAKYKEESKSKSLIKKENKKLKELLEQVKTNPDFDKSVLDK